MSSHDITLMTGPAWVEEAWSIAMALCDGLEDADQGRELHYYEVSLTLTLTLVLTLRC